MRLANELSTRLVRAATTYDSPQSEILHRGESTGEFVPGAVLEGAVRWADHYALFMSDDVPFEEILGIHVLDDRFRTVDSAYLGGPYMTGAFDSLTLTGPDTIEFRFLGEATWKVRLLGETEFRFPIFSEPPGVWRPFGFRRRFVVTRELPKNPSP